MDAGHSRSSSAPIRRRASRYYRAVGSSNEPSRGSADADGSQRTSKQPSPAPSPGSSLPISARSLGGSQDFETEPALLSQTLRRRRSSVRDPNRKSGSMDSSTGRP